MLIVNRHQHRRLAMQIDLEGDVDQVTAADALFEVAGTEDGPAIMSVEATTAAGRTEGAANALANISSLEPGLYVARAKVTAGGAVATIRRTFSVRAAESGPAGAVRP